MGRTLKRAFALVFLAGLAAQDAARAPTLEDHARRLSAPDMNGRMTGTPGARKASEYIGVQFLNAGLRTTFQEFPGHGGKGRNVIGVAPGETTECVIVGAHYDHLGAGRDGRVYYGADDNASGTAVLLEVARRFGAKPSARRIVFVAFSGEEMGLFGSRAYVNNPVVPIGKTVAMVNMDMVGRLREKLIIFGTATGDRFKEYLKDSPIRIAYGNDPVGPSDHTSFYLKGVPAVHFFTGAHADYHKPTDTADKLNYDGMRKIADLVETLVRRIAGATERMKFNRVELAAPKITPGARPYFGSVPDYGYEGKGARLAGVTPGSPCEKAGLKEGDVIIAIGDDVVADVNGYAQALFSRKAGEKIRIVYLRGGEEQKTTATLAARKASAEGQLRPARPKVFLGVSMDPQHQGKGVRVLEVVPKSSAAKAKLQAGDVILAINRDELEGRDTLIQALMKYKPGDEVTLTYLRDGKRRTTKTKLDSIAKMRTEE